VSQKPTDLERRAHWRRRAEEARSLARETSDDRAKQALLDIARFYEAMADRPATRRAHDMARRETN